MDLYETAATLDNLAFTVRDGWQQDADKAADLIQQASFLLERAAYATRVRNTLESLALKGSDLCEDSELSRSHLCHDKRLLHLGSYALTHSSARIGDYLNLTIAVWPDDRQTVIDALVGEGLVEGWDGSQSEFEEARSDFGWISVRTVSRAHPAN